MILLSIGSNQGDRLALFAQAAALLAEKGVKILEASAVYETEPFGFHEQPPFLNAVLVVETTAVPEQLLAVCLAVETALGRKRSVRWGPRTLDLDILYISGIQCHSEQLTLPHPGLFQRAFVLVPLAELAPEVIFDGHSFAWWRDACADSGSVRKILPKGRDLLKKG